MKNVLAENKISSDTNREDMRIGTNIIHLDVF